MKSCHLEIKGGGKERRGREGGVKKNLQHSFSS